MKQHERNQEFLQVAISAAKLAGGVLQEWSEKFTVQEKSPANLVTEADFASQEAILSFIRDRYSDHQFLGEEDLDESNDQCDYRWVIDPLDGTSNYVHHFPYYAVSIALEYKNELELGVIYDPTRKELFSAIRGEGAFLNGSPIHTSTRSDLRKALVVFSLPVGTDANHPAVQQFLRVLPRAQHIQRTGSAALNLAYIASGRLEAYWSLSLKPWDMAAGVLLVQEAGGRVTTCNGQPVDIRIPDLLSTNGTSIHEQLSGLLSDESIVE